MGALVATDEAGLILHFNHRAEQLFGRPAASVLGQPLTVLMPARMHERHHAGFDRYLSTHQSHLLGKPVRVPARRGDGVEVEIELVLRMFRRPDGTDLIVAACRPAAESHTPERDLLRLESRLEQRLYQLV